MIISLGDVLYWRPEPSQSHELRPNQHQLRDAIGPSPFCMEFPLEARSPLKFPRLIVPLGKGEDGDVGESTHHLPSRVHRTKICRVLKLKQP
jgi:hypothetical protein